MLKFNGPSSRLCRAGLLVCAMTLCSPIAPASAHHSTANFDFTKTVNITGVVTYLSITNPHSFFDIKVADGDNVKEYKVFATARVALQRHGWKPDTVKVGDTISIEGNPDKENPLFLNMRVITFRDGSKWSTSEVYE
jgi:hypothetical protein